MLGRLLACVMQEVHQGESKAVLGEHSSGPLASTHLVQLAGLIQQPAAALSCRGVHH